MAALAADRPVQKVLAVDDDKSVLAGLARTLGRDRVVVTASDPLTATCLARSERPELAIVDLRLGMASGIDLVRTLRAFAPDMIIVLLSGYLSTEQTVDAVHAGANFVMAKPVTADEILSRIEGLRHATDRIETPTLAAVQDDHIARVLADCQGNVSEAARRLDISRSSLQRWLRKRLPNH